ncbi:hypothetical protein HY256_00350, partial [Candidatus Sumerlaeota bacterium]|nr:hypothetical protein [Candidatus Sumerlaeota bacterium]
MGKSSDHLSTSKYILLGGTGMFVVMLATMPVSPAHAALTAFMAAAALCGWVASRGLLKGVAVERRHRPRVFEDDRVPVTLAVRQTAGHPQTLVVVEDQFYASLSIRQRHLIPMLTRQWEAHLHYNKEAERHRGIYMLGPIEVWAADPLGLFARRIELDCVTPLTVYPKAVPLPGYRLLGPHPPAGPTLEAYHRIGQGEEIISVRPYQ